MPEKPKTPLDYYYKYARENGYKVITTQWGWKMEKL
jgi:hypothetical protein